MSGVALLMDSSRKNGAWIPVMALMKHLGGKNGAWKGEIDGIPSRSLMMNSWAATV